MLSLALTGTGIFCVLVGVRLLTEPADMVAVGSNRCLAKGASVNGTTQLGLEAVPVPPDQLCNMQLQLSTA